MNRISEREALLPGAEPFWYPASGDVGCVLVHGFTGSPNEVRDLGQYLAKRGIASRGVLLDGHGTRPAAMACCSYRHWVANVESAVDELLAVKQRVFLIGLSMGGTLALNVAARRVQDGRLGGVVALAAPLRLFEWRPRLTPIAGLLGRVRRWHRPDIKDERQWERHVAYRRLPLVALPQLFALLGETRRLLPELTQPILVIHSQLDNTVPAFNARLIVDNVSSEWRRIVWLDNCYHVVTLDHDSDRVQAEIGAFLREHG